MNTDHLKYIVAFLLSGLCAISYAQPQRMLADTVSLGYDMDISLSTGSQSVTGVSRAAFTYSPPEDVQGALYGKIAGYDAVNGLLRGHEPLVLVDGFPRSMSELTSFEIESAYILTDAVASALYGVRGANGVLMVTTRRGKSDALDINAQYQFGLSLPFRRPVSADSYTYALSVNEALAGDGLQPRYNARELEAFRSGTFPYEYPDVDWWKETMNDFATSHSLKLSFTGGSGRFRHYTVVDFLRDRSLFKENRHDKRYSTAPTDTRLSVRTNIDVMITGSTSLKAGVSARLQELNGTVSGTEKVLKAVLGTPAAAFPVKYMEGVYGGSSVYGDANPVALLVDKGHSRNMYGTLLADLRLRQELDIITEGLAAEVLVSFDNSGGMKETTSKSYRYMNAYPMFAEDGTLVTTPVYYGTDSQTLGHSQPFESLMMRSDFQAKVSYDRMFGAHKVGSALIYDMQSSIVNGRNNSAKRQSVLLNASYIYADRYVLNAVVNHSGSAYLPDGDKFHTYPAVSAAWVLSNEDFMKNADWLDLLKIRASYGLSGWDGDLTHELWRQYFGSGNGYWFGAGPTFAPGTSEGSLPVVGLVPQKSEKVTLGLDFSAFGNRLRFTADAFRDYRSDSLVSGSSSTSEIIGIGIGKSCDGEYIYRGADLTLTWDDTVGPFRYGAGLSASYLTSEIINENQEYQEYDYLYTKGNRVGQCYGLEATGFFNSQLEINNSVPQNFSTVRPGDVRYKDQNADNVIDSKDMVKMFGSRIPEFQFGFSLYMGYGGFEILADFQGVCGVTLSLLDSPLYKPLINNGNISATFLENEVPWTYDNRKTATMPRLTTVSNANNHQPSSLWYRDGSYLKLRNLVLSYTFPKSMLKFADMKIFLQGNNVFSIDGIGFADPQDISTLYPSMRSFLAGIKFNF